MAHARLREVQHTNDRWYYVTNVNVWSGPFRGATGRSWSAFEVVDACVAQYEWRSRADVIRDIAVGAAEGGITVDDARRDLAFAAYVIDKLDDAGDVDADGEAQFVADICADIAAGNIDLCAHDEVYDLEADLYLADAARALTPLPQWTTLRFVDEGGPGSGYSLPCIVLDEGHTLIDLAEYFATLAPEVH